MEKWVLAIFVVLVLAGCGSTPSSNSSLSQTSNSPNTGAQQSSSDELNKVLNARGFYKTKLDNINYLAHRKCSNFELQSHRGSVAFPENSVASVIHAIDNQFDVVEIDVMLTGSRDWFVHHDKKTGRATGTVDNEQRRISRLRKDDYGYLRHRNPSTGLLTDTVPPSFTTIARYFSRHASPHQRLNIEIKSNASRRYLEILDYLAFSIIGEGRYFYSSLELDNLTRMRALNPQVYMAFIQNPAKESLNVLAADLKKGAGSDPVYLRHKEDLEAYQAKANRYARTTRYDNNRAQFLKLRKALTSNYGLNVDIRHFVNSQKTLMEMARYYDVPIGTYTINGQKYHHELLKKTSASDRPDTVIIDDTVYGFCSGFELPTASKVSSSDPFASLVASLPNDLDLSRLDELNLYATNGLYPAVGGKLKSVTPNHVMQLDDKKKQRPSLQIGSREKEEEFSLEVGDTLELELRQSDEEK